MTALTRIPTSAVLMTAAHLYLDRVKNENVLPRDLERTRYGGEPGQTFADHYAQDAARDAWRLARAVADAQPVDL